MYINRYSKLHEELFGIILDVLEDRADGFYHCDLISENEHSFELIYSSEVDDFICENLNEVFETIADLQKELGDISFLWKGGADTHQIAWVVRLEIARKIYYEVLNEFEEEENENLWNCKIEEDSEVFQAFKEYANKRYDDIFID